MNTTILSLTFLKGFQSSSSFFSTNYQNYNINFCNFQFFINLFFLKNINSNIFVSKTNFKNFLNGILLIFNNKNIIYNSDLYFYQYILFEDILFQNFSILKTNSLIFINNSNINITINRCGFSKISNNDNNPLIHINFCNKLICSTICSQNLNLYYPFFGISSHLYNINYVNFNYSTIFNNTYSWCSDWIGGIEKFIFNNNNISFISTNTHRTGMCFTNSIEAEVGTFSQIINCNGITFFSFYDLRNKIMYLNSFNFLNNSVTGGWFDIGKTIGLITIKNSIFLNNNNNKKWIYFLITNSKITFENCYFGQNPTLPETGVIIINSFQGNLNNIISLNINSYYCWYTTNIQFCITNKAVRFFPS